MAGLSLAEHEESMKGSNLARLLSNNTRTVGLKLVGCEFIQEQNWAKRGVEQLVVREGSAGPEARPRKEGAKQAPSQSYTVDGSPRLGRSLSIVIGYISLVILQPSYTLFGLGTPPQSAWLVCIASLLTVRPYERLLKRSNLA